MQLTIVWLLLIVTVSITYLLQRSGFSRIVPPSVVAMTLGIIVGVVVNSSDGRCEAFEIIVCQMHLQITC